MLGQPIAMGLFQPEQRRAGPGLAANGAAKRRIERETEPRAIAARYDAASDLIAIELANGATFAFPPRLAERLAGARPDALAEVEIVGRGYRLRWDRLDADYSVGGLVAGIFATPC